MNNGILPITVSCQVLDNIFSKIESNPNHEFKIELEKQILIIADVLTEKEVVNFEIDTYKKECLIKGYDDIDYLLNMKEEIIVFEKQQVIY